MWNKKWTDEELIRHVNESKTISEVVRKLHIGRNKENREFLLKECERLNISIDHFSTNKENRIKDDVYIDSNSQLAKDIQYYRNLGKSYSEIAKLCNCAKSTVAYHCKNGVRNQTQKYSKNRRKILNWWVNFCRNFSRFKSRVHNYESKQVSFTKPWRQRLNWKVQCFKSVGIKNKNFTAKDLLKHLGGTTIKCYLTGRTIDLTKDDYQFDHKQPVSKGGSCDLENLGITCPDANQSKTNLNVEEYISLCKEVLENFGYKVEKIE